VCRFDPKNKSRFIDPCLKNLIGYLNGQGIETVACCCGHGIYPMSIIVRTKEPGVTMDACSGAMFRDRKKYYRRDADGVYFIPETVKA
jgi:hypothetical protein